MLYGLAPSQDLSLLLLRVLLGSFFVLARFRWVYDPPNASSPYAPMMGWFPKYKHISLQNKMCRCGYPRWFAGPVALAEIVAGILVILGALTVPAAVILFIITIVATCCTAKEKVLEQKPVDKLDYVSCYLWRVEGLYIVMALILVLNGPGNISIDVLL